MIITVTIKMITKILIIENQVKVLLKRKIKKKHELQPIIINKIIIM